MTALQDIFARPIAHRGYHDAGAGVIENSPKAISAAMARGFGIEVDIQETADGQALVFHDYTLDRLVEGTGKVIAHSAQELCEMTMKTGGDRLWLLQDLFGLLAGKVAVVIEIKSLMRPGAQADFVRHVVDLTAAYSGPAAIKTFDPDMLAVARARNPAVLRGIVASAARKGGEFGRLSNVHRFALRHMLHFPRTRPDFISYCINDLPSPAPGLLRRAFNKPVMTWTVRTAEERARAARYADQMVFEGFDPDHE